MKTLNEVVITDIETMGKRSSSIILDMAILYVDFSKEPLDEGSFQRLRERTMQVKFDCAEQASLGRTVDQDTIDWWKKQSTRARKVLLPSDKDISITNIDRVFQWYLERNEIAHKENTMMWLARGNLDYNIISDIYWNQLKKDEPYKFWNIKDTRSLIHGIADIPRGKFDVDEKYLPDDVCEHDSIDDVCLEALRFMMLRSAIDN